MKVPIGFWRPDPGESEEAFAERVRAGIEAAVCGERRCDYVPRPGRAEDRCRRPAVLRVLYRHGDGEAPEYRRRCVFHATAHLGPLVAAAWDPLREEWVEVTGRAG